MSPKYTMALVIISDAGLVLYDPANIRQVRDIHYLIHGLAKDECSVQLITVESAKELLADAYPKNPRLPVGRPAVICGSPTTRTWYRFCRDADAEVIKSVANLRCNNAVTTT